MSSSGAMSAMISRTIFLQASLVMWVGKGGVVNRAKNRGKSRS